MKTKEIIRYVGYGLTFILFMSLSLKSNAQVPLLMADTIGVWSEPQPVTINDPKNGNISLSIRNKLIKHYGTTGVYMIEVTNKSTRRVRGFIGLKVAKKGTQMNVNNASRFDLLKNYYATYKLELRECLPKGARLLDDLQKCKACDPLICFAEVY